MAEAAEEALLASTSDKCAGCERESPKLRCGRCGLQWYCARECQVKAYPTHKVACIAIGKRRKRAAKAWMDAAVLWYKSVYSASPSHEGMERAVEMFSESLMDSSDLRESGSWFMHRATFVGLLHSDGASVDVPDDVRSKMLETSELILASACKADPISAREAFVERALNFERARDLEGAARVARESIDAKTRGLNWINPLQRPGVCMPDLRASAFWDASEFPWAQALEDAVETISAELASLLKRKPAWPDVGSEYRESGNEDAQALDHGQWSEWVLFGSGAQPDAAPKTCALLERLVPDAIDLANKGAGEIIFSRLDGNSAIIPHCASTNTRLTAHLGLVIPSASTETFVEDGEGGKTGRCAIRVGASWQTWSAGKLLFFDDSFEHEVVNNTGEERIILLIRFWHPDLPVDLREVALETTTKASAVLQLARSVPPVQLGAEHEPFGIAQQALVFGCTNCFCPDKVLDVAALHASPPQLSLRCPECHAQFKNRIM